MKKIILLIILLILVLGLSACMKTSPIDLGATETEIQTILSNQRELSAEIARLADQTQPELALEKNNLLKEKLNQALDLNQIIIDNIKGDKKDAFVKRKELFLANLKMVDKMEECLGYMEKDKEAFEKCQTEFIGVVGELENKRGEL